MPACSGLAISGHEKETLHANGSVSMKLYKAVADVAILLALGLAEMNDSSNTERESVGKR